MDRQAPEMSNGKQHAVAKVMARSRRLALTADSFDEMEETVAKMGQRLQQILLGAAAEQRQPDGKPRVCPQCGTSVENKGLKSRQLKISIGLI